METAREIFSPASSFQHFPEIPVAFSCKDKNKLWPYLFVKFTHVVKSLSSVICKRGVEQF